MAKSSSFSIGKAIQSAQIRRRVRKQLPVWAEKYASLNKPLNPSAPEVEAELSKIASQHKADLHQFAMGTNLVAMPAEQCRAIFYLLNQIPHACLLEAYRMGMNHSDVLVRQLAKCGLWPVILRRYQYAEDAINAIRGLKPPVIEEEFKLTVYRLAGIPSENTLPFLASLTARSDRFPRALRYATLGLHIYFGHSVHPHGYYKSLLVGACLTKVGEDVRLYVNGMEYVFNRLPNGNYSAGHLEENHVNSLLSRLHQETKPAFDLSGELMTDEQTKRLPASLKKGIQQIIEYHETELNLSR